MKTTPSALRLSVLTVWLLLSAVASAQTADSTIVAYLRSEGVGFTHSNQVKLLKNGQEKFDDLLPAIRNAESSVHMEYFNFRNDSIANLLFDLLAAKAAQGVEVRLLYDAFGNSSNNRPLKREHIESLRARGIEIYEFDPLRFPWVNHIFARDHRKIVVIDGRTAYTGGMNVADYYIHGTPVVGEWHDMHCRIEGPEVDTLQLIFLDTWQKVTGQTILGQKYYRGSLTSPLPSPGANQAMLGIVNREPRTTNKLMRKFYLAAIDSAQDSLKIINPYFTLSRPLKRALKRAAERGVKVDVMLSTKSDISLTPDCNYYNAHWLMKRGCNIWMFQPGFHHTKILTVDDRLCTVGSANLDARSLRWDYEENAVIVSPAVTAELNQLFIDEKSDSFLLTPDTWNQFRTPWQKFRGWFAHLLSPFL